MSESALSISPGALLLAIAAYVLKRWWDNADSITSDRKEAYRQYYEACYFLVNSALEGRSESGSEDVAKAYYRLQERTPSFYLCASPLVISISDVFFRRALPFVHRREGDRGSKEYLEHARNLTEALNVLREVMKSELFMSSPRFQIERWMQRRKWQSFTERADK